MSVVFLPVLIVFLVGMLTHRVIPALLLGLITAALVSTGFSFPEALSLLVSQLWNNLEFQKVSSSATFKSASQLYVIGFVITSNLLFDLIKESKGTWAILNFMNKRIRTRKHVETASLLLSHLFFIDGLMSSLMVSSLMRPFSKIHGIPRAKIALLADSMATPLALLCPFSCFTALLISILAKHGAGTGSSETLVRISPNVLYLLAVPFFFYSLTLIPMIWLIVQNRLSWGPMKQLELQAPKETIDLEKESSSATLYDFLVPALSFVLFIPFYGFLFTEKNALFASCPVALVLFLSGLSSSLLSMIYYLSSKRFTILRLFIISYRSFQGIFRCLLLIILAWTFASIMNHHLKIGTAVKLLISGTIPIAFLPFIFFLASGLVALSLGTSWGTSVMFLPITIPMIISFHEYNHIPTIEEVPMLLPVIGAVISGSVLGDHLSILSDSTILSSKGAGCGLVEHFKTQLPFGIPVVIAASLGFLIAGMTAELPYPISFLIPLLISSGSVLAALSVNKRKMTVYHQDW